MSDVVYLAVVLDSESHNELHSWWEDTFAPIRDRVFCHHMTIAFKPSVEEIASHILGESLLLKVHGYVRTKECGVVVVNGCPSANKRPHVTIFTDLTTPPSYANDLLEVEAIKAIDGPYLSGRVGAMVKGKIVYTLEES